MERFIAMLMSWVMAWQPINLMDTWQIQEQYVIENYFKWTTDMAPIVYRSGRILGKTTTESNYTNRADCSWIGVGYMRELGITNNRNLDTVNWEASLDSYWLYLLGKPKKKSEVKRWDFIFMVWPDWVKHFAVSCDDSGEMIYDLYKGNELKCRHMTAPTMKYATNGIVEYLNQENIVLSWTVEVINYFQKVKEAAMQESWFIMTWDITLRDKIVTFVSWII